MMILKRIMKSVKKAMRPDPLILSAQEHLAKCVLLPCEASADYQFVTVVNELIFFPFYQKMSHSLSDYTDASLFGIGEMDMNKDFDVSLYPLPVCFPDVKSCPHDSLRIFILKARSGNDLIFHFKDPKFPDPFLIDHYIYCFETDKKRWSRILSVGEDGSYSKLPAEFRGDMRNRPLESESNVYRTARGSLVIWSPTPGKLRVEPDSGSTPSPEVEHFEEESRKALRSVEAYNFHASHSEPVRIDKMITKERKREFIPHYEIFGVEEELARRNAFASEDISSDNVIIRPQRAVRFVCESKVSLGLFINYIIPRKHAKGIFLLFEYEEDV